MTEEELLAIELGEREARKWKWVIVGIALILVAGVTLLVGAASYAMLKSNEERDQTCEALVVFVKNARRLSNRAVTDNPRSADQAEAINQFYNDLLDGLSCYKKEEDIVRQS
jgi:hypothetical protein